MNNLGRVSSANIKRIEAQQEKTLEEQKKADSQAKMLSFMIIGFISWQLMRNYK